MVKPLSSTGGTDAILILWNIEVSITRSDERSGSEVGREPPHLNKRMTLLCTHRLLVGLEGKGVSAALLVLGGREVLLAGRELLLHRRNSRRGSSSLSRGSRGSGSGVLQPAAGPDAGVSRGGRKAEHKES
jgi:hypothetical protein